MTRLCRLTKEEEESRKENDKDKGKKTFSHHQGIYNQMKTSRDMYMLL